VRWYSIYLNPEPWAVGDLGIGRRNGKIYPYMGRNNQLYSYQQAVKQELQSQDPAMVEGPLSLIFVFFREVETEHDRSYADVTNLQKGLEDALQGVLFKNDRQTRYIQSYLVNQGPTVTGQIYVGIDQYYGEVPTIPTDVMSTRSSAAAPAENTHVENPEEFF
jgi:Holliday junction resolvase RusA-like endonuclease